LIVARGSSNQNIGVDDEKLAWKENEWVCAHMLLVLFIWL
jgi:hypothetical protein